MSGTRRLLTFRLDRDFRQRLATRLAGEGRTMSEVVIFGLQLYVQRSVWLSGGSAAAETAEPDEIGETSELTFKLVTNTSLGGDRKPCDPEQFSQLRAHDRRVIDDNGGRHLTRQTRPLPRKINTRAIRAW